MGTVLEVGGHAGAEFGTYIIIEIIRDLPPHFFTVDFNRLFGQAPCSVPRLPPTLRSRRTSLTTGSEGTNRPL